MRHWSVSELVNSGGLPTVRDGLADDLFLVSVSYEDRTLTVVQSLSNQYRARKGIVYVNQELLKDPFINKVGPHLEELTRLLALRCDSVDRVEGSWLDPRIQLLALRDGLVTGKDLEQTQAITIDTTTFNRESLLTAIALLRNHFPYSKMRVAYTSPQKHGEWLSQGYRTVRNVMSFAGIQQSSLPTLLVVLSGFEPERTLKLIEEHEPSKVLLGIGDPPTNQQFLQRNLDEQKLILARQEVQKFSFPASDMVACRESLESLVRPYLRSHNIALAPMSTKLSTLAVFLIAEDHPEIQITYCVPGEYNSDNYSSGSDKVFVGELPRRSMEAESL